MPPVPARPPALTLHTAGESHHPPPAPRCQGNLPSSRPARGARGRGRGASPGPRRAGASSTAGPRARSPRGRRAPVTASRGARSPGVGAAGQTPPPRGAAPDARRAAPPSLPPAPSLRSPRRQTNGMRGAGKRPRPGRRLRRPRAPSLTLEEGDARGAAGRPPGRGGAARWAPRARAPAPEAPRRLPAAGRRARGGAGGAGGGRGRWGTSGSCGGHGVKCKLTMGWPGRPGRAGARAASLLASPSPVKAGRGAGSLVMLSRGPGRPAVTQDDHFPRPSGALLAALPASHHWLETQPCEPSSPAQISSLLIPFC